VDKDEVISRRKQIMAEAREEADRCIQETRELRERLLASVISESLEHSGEPMSVEEAIALLDSDGPR